MASILDVARKAGVAPSTVSLVINGKSRVKDSTREHVQEVIKQMNWQPRSAAADKKPYHIGILYGRYMMLSGELVDYCRKWIAGIRESFDDQGAHLTVNVGAEHIDQDLMFGRSLEKGDFDSVIFMGVLPQDGYLERALNCNLPVIVMNQKPQRNEFSSVCADAWESGRMAAERLLQLGHKKLTTLLTRRSNTPSNDLYGGFTEVLAENKVPLALDIEDKPPLDFDNPATINPVAQYMLDAGVTACFTGDPLAMRLVDSLEAMGVEVPREFSVLGWDDLGFTTKSRKKLSSIGYSKQTMGLLAGQMCENLLSMDGKITNLAATVPTYINSGETIGALQPGI